MCLITVRSSQGGKEATVAEANTAFDVFFTQLTGSLSSHVIGPHILT